MTTFLRHIGIDYSGAETPTASLKGLRAYLAEGDGSPVEVPPPPGTRKYWTRRLDAYSQVVRRWRAMPKLRGLDPRWPMASLKAGAGVDYPAIDVSRIA